MTICEETKVKEALPLTCCITMHKLCKLVLVSPAIKWDTGYLPPHGGVPSDLQMKSAILELGTITFCSLMQIGGKVVAFPLIVNYPFYYTLHKTLSHFN